MKKFNKFLTWSLVIIASTILVSSCEDDKLESDSGKVVPKIFNFDGPAVGFEGETLTYVVTPPRGGSEYIWTVVGAEAKPIEGRTDKMNVFFNQTAELASVSVKEKAFNGLESEASTIDGIIVLGTPCEWTVNMVDDYGDGWNGGSVTFSVEGGIEVGNVTLDDGASGTAKVLVPNGSEVEISYNSGDYDIEVSYQVIDASGNTVLDEGYDPTGAEPTIGVVYNELNTCP